MSSSVFLLIVVVLVGASLLFWLNFAMMRASGKRGTQPDRQVDPDVKGTENTVRSGFPVNDSPDATDSAPDFETVASVAPTSGENAPVEIVHRRSAATRRIFDQNPYPFLVHGVSVPAFSEEPWIRCFFRLRDEPQVLGWVAFREEVVGASDRNYDPDFLDALRHYRRSVQRLTKEVGISNLIETSVVGDEGKVWILAAIDDAWLALFVERSTDVATLTEEILESLRSDDRERLDGRRD